MRHLTGMRDIADQFDGFIVDLWGVVHDGVHALPGAPDCLARLHRAGKRIVLLSNAPRRAGLVVEQLRGLGVADELYDRVVTSGEVTRALLRARNDPFFQGLGHRLYLLGPARDSNILEDIDEERAADLEHADYLLNTGPDDDRPGSGELYRPLLEQAYRLSLPMLCANPDLEIVRGGQRIICAGLLAREFAAMGGKVKLVGKPDPAVYRPIMKFLDLPKSRVCAIGDALATDIAGAAGAGLDSIWVLGGIHHELLRNPAGAKQAASAAGLTPIAWLPSFVW